MCRFNGARRSRYFGDEVFSKEEVIVQMRKLMNDKSVDIDEIICEMIKNRSKILMKWMSNHSKKAIVEGNVLEDWKRTVKGKKEKKRKKIKEKILETVETTRN